MSTSKIKTLFLASIFIAVSAAVFLGSPLSVQAANFCAVYLTSQSPDPKTGWFVSVRAFEQTESPGPPMFTVYWGDGTSETGTDFSANFNRTYSEGFTHSYTSSRTFKIVLSSTDISPCAETQATVVIPQNTGEIYVTSNVSTSWNISGPDNFSGSGISGGPYTAFPGSYSISAPAIDCYSGPVVTSPQDLASGGSITFNLAYTSAECGGGGPPPPPPPPPPGNYTLTVSINSGLGAITGEGINCPGDCSESYPDGKWVNLIATQSSGYSFEKWLPGSGKICSGQGSSCWDVINGNKTAAVNFHSDSPPPGQGGGYTLTLFCNNGAGPCVVDSGATPLITWDSNHDVCQIIINGNNENSATGVPTGHIWWGPVYASFTTHAYCYQLTGGDYTERDVYVIVPAPPPPPPATQCSNGIDDDGDGLTDYPTDPGCSDQGDNGETDPPPPGIPVSCSASPLSGVIGQQISWTANVSGGTGPFTYAWSGTNIPTPAPGGNPYRITYNTIGQKTTSVTITDSLNAQGTCPAVTAQVNFFPHFEEF